MKRSNLSIDTFQEIGYNVINNKDRRKNNLNPLKECYENGILIAAHREKRRKYITKHIKSLFDSIRHNRYV